MKIGGVWPQILKQCMSFFNNFLWPADDLDQNRGGQKWIPRNKRQLHISMRQVFTWCKSVCGSNQYVDQITAVAFRAAVGRMAANTTTKKKRKVKKKIKKK
jgi:hypothetical protein